MTLKEVGIVIGKKLVSRRGDAGFNLIKPIIVDFEDVALKDRNMLISACGRGKTITKAKADYCKRIRGQILVVGAWKKTRKEFQLPPKITVR